MKTFSAVKALLSARLRANLKDRMPVFSSLLNTALLALSVYVVIEVFFGNVDDIGGWNKEQSVVLYGAFILIRSFVQMVVLPNCEAASKLIISKSIDTYLSKPIDIQTILAFGQLRLWHIFGVVLGLGLMLGGSHAQGQLTVASVSAFVVFLTLSCALVHAVWFSIASLAFWTQKTGNISHLLFMFLTTGRFPSGAYPEWIQIVIMTIVPVFFIMEVPAQSALGMTTGATLLGALAATAGFALLSRLLWHWGVKKYLREGS
ncbi:ABC-2 family transporter protein [Pseudomonas sp. MSSRFD41]|uniref:ABC transporter permease n=1 Tax=unclassified Pseudomonas TaxID=196821 RepID=UPI00163AE10D|nr:ABC-2 family transporter protein [Pseudomonas sp. MSSRFD41]MBC2656609.1 ABC-2 family transporter protein [Pseudomonas sp. MSSRFD41]